MAIQNPVAALIRKIRIKNQLTQSELAKIAGIPRASLALMENLKGNPSIHSVVQVAEALGIGVGELLEIKPSESIHLTRRSAMNAKELDSGKYLSVKICEGGSKSLLAEHIELKPGGSVVVGNGLRGQQRLIYCIKHRIQVESRGELFDLDDGDLLEMPANIECILQNKFEHLNHTLMIIKD